jgi:hypothetical protein
MDRAKLSVAIVVVMALATLQWGPDRVASADSKYSRHLAVLVTDVGAMGHSEGGADLSGSFISMLAALRDDQLFMFMNVDNPSQVLGPYRMSDPEYPSIQSEIEARLTWPVAGEAGELSNALLAAQSVLNQERGMAGSEVYVITGDAPWTDFDRLSVQLSPLVNRFREQGWKLNGVSLPGASPEAQEFLNGISDSSGGHFTELSSAEGLKDVADTILSRGAMGSLSGLGSRVLVTSEFMSSVLTIVPGTSETTILLIRENPEGSLKLTNPSGFSVSPLNGEVTQLVEMPNAVMWRLKDPVPGNWKIDARDMRGLVSAWQYSANNYTLVLIPTAPLPLGQPTPLVAYVGEGDRAVVLDDVRLYANITIPDGARIVIEMNDNGAGSDVAAGDGNYTMMLPPLRVEGGYEVELEMVWLDYNHRISALTGFEARIYPELSVDLAGVDDIQPGVKTSVAIVVVHVDGEPYPVAPEQVAAILNSTAGLEAEVEVVPRRVYGDGPAFEYEVFLTVQDHGRYSLAFRLGTEYSGRFFSLTTESMAISSQPPPTLVREMEQVVAEVAPAVVPVSALPPSPAPAMSNSPSSFPMLVVWIPIIVLAILGAIASYLLTRTRPYGFIYSDSDEPLVDFAAIRRHPIVDLVRRSTVSGKDLDLPGLEGVVFRFAKGRIRLSNSGDQPTVRVNNQPLIGDAAIEDRTWIGTGGKLYTFLDSAGALQEGAGAD